MKKFEFTGEVKTLADGTEVKRIRVLKELRTFFGVVKMGELGGWLEKESNLSQEGVCWVSGDARVEKNTHLLWIGPVGSRGDTVTFYRDADKGIRVRCGCFSGTLDEFECKVRETHGNNKHAHVYHAAMALARLQIEDTEENKKAKKKKVRLFAGRETR